MRPELNLKDKSQMSTPNEYSDNFKSNLICTFLSVWTKLKKTLCPRTQCSSFYKIPSLKIQLPLFLAVIYHFPRIKRSSKNCPCVMWGHLFWRWVWKENCFSDLPNFMYCVESCQLTYLVQKLGTKRMRSMHSAQDCKSKFYCKGQRPQICFADIYGKLSLNDYILLFLHL